MWPAVVVAGQMYAFTGIRPCFVKPGGMSLLEQSAQEKLYPRAQVQAKQI